MAEPGIEPKDPQFQGHPQYTEEQHLKRNVLKEKVLD